MSALPLCADTSRRRERFDPSSLRLVARIEYDAVHVAAFSPDGLTLAVSTGATVRILSAGSWSERRVVRLDGVVRALAYSPDSSSMLAGGPHTELRRIDLATGRADRWWALDVRPTALAWTERFVAVGAAEGVDLIDPATGGALVHRTEAPAGPYSMAVSDDGQRIAVASKSERSVHLTHDSVLAGGCDGRVRMGGMELKGHGGPVHAVVFSRAHQLYVSAGGRTVRFWRAGDFENVATLPHAGPEVDTIAVAPGGRWLATATTDGVLRIYGR